MDHPPPPPPLFSAEPPPPQPGRQRSSAKWLVGLAAVAVLVVAVAIAVAVGVPALKKYRQVTEAKKEERLEALKPRLPLTKEQEAAVEAFGRELAEALKKGDAAKLAAVVDMEGLGDRVFLRLGQVGPLDEARRSFEKGLRSNPGGLFAQALGQDARYMARVERDGFPAVRLRLLLSNGAMNFLDVLATVREDGTVKAVDMFTFALGTYATAEARNAIGTVMQNEGGNPLLAALGMPQYDTEALKIMNEMRTAQRLGRGEQVIQLYDGLKEAHKQERIFFLMYLQAVMNQDMSDAQVSERYRGALQEAKRVLGQESAPEMLEVDLKFMEGDFAGAAAAAAKVEETVGEDAYLKFLQATMLVKQGKVDEASALEREASALEPELLNLVDLRLAIHLTRKDYKGMVGEMRAFKEKHRAVLGRKELNGAEFEEFLKSPEFAAWEAENR